MRARAPGSLAAPPMAHEGQQGRPHRAARGGCTHVCIHVCCVSVCVFRFSSCTSNGSRGATGLSTPCSEGWLHARVCMYVCCVCVCMCVCVIRFSSCISISPQEALSCAMDRRVSHNLQMYIIITCAALTPRHSLW